MVPVAPNTTTKDDCGDEEGGRRTAAVGSERRLTRPVHHLFGRQHPHRDQWYPYHTAPEG